MSAAAGKYARYEFERRFLLAGAPDGLAADQGWQIADRYLIGTHLRLRRTEPLNGGDAVYKLGQKEVPEPPDFATMTMTSMYLSADEYNVLAALPARELTKRRFALVGGDRTFSVDIFEGPLAGLILAEVGFATRAEMARPAPLPPWVSCEVSDDIRFTGGALAQLSADQARALVAAALARRADEP